MNQLAKLQQLFQTCVLVPNDTNAPAWVSAGGRAQPEIQLSVYSHGYRARLIEVLASDFSAVRMAIGEDKFDELANAYIHAHPSHYFSLRDFGAHLPDFIQHADGHANWPWLYELAQFEWTLCSAFDAADAPTLTEQAMAAIAPEAWAQLHFVAVPSVHRLGFKWNTPEMWKVLTADIPTEVLAQASDTPSFWLIWRDQLITRFRSLAEDEQCALEVLCAGGDFDEICGALIPFHEIEAIPLCAATLLKTWIGQGLIREFDIESR